MASPLLPGMTPMPGPVDPMGAAGPAMPAPAPKAAPPPPPTQITDQLNSDLVEFAREAKRFLDGQLDEYRQQAVSNWKRYYSKRDDPRDPITEKWRSHIVVPQAMFNTEAKAAQMIEILMSADPPIQPNPIFESNEADAKGIQQLLDYTMRINYFRKFLAATSRAAIVQGTEFFKTTWKHKRIVVPNRETQQQVQDFQDKLQETMRMMGIQPDMVPDWQLEPEAFEQWRQLINSAQRGAQLPPAPSLTGAPKEVTQFLGPTLERIPFWQLTLDPLIQELSDQPVIIHEIFKPREWLLANTGPGKAYDEKRVMAAIDSGLGDKVSAEQQDLANQLGIPSGVGQNPQFARPVRIWEVWRLNSKYPFSVVLNEQQVINKNPEQNPFEHGMAPFGAARNILVPGMALGLSDITPAAGLFDEQDTLRSLRLDKVTLYTLPAFQRLRGMGIPDLVRKLTPGAMIDVDRMNSIAPLFPGDINPSAYNEAHQTSLDVDRSFGIGENVRGASSTVGRVSATESSNRLTQALTRVKMGAAQFEDDFNPVVSQWLALWAQYGDKNAFPTTGGYNPLADLDRNKLMTAISQDYQFRGATQALSRELQAQQLMMFNKVFSAYMIPAEVRALMKEVATAMGLRSISKIVSPTGDQVKTAEYAAQAQAAAAQNSAASGATETSEVAAGLPAALNLGGGA